MNLSKDAMLKRFNDSFDILGSFRSERFQQTPKELDADFQKKVTKIFMAKCDETSRMETRKILREIRQTVYSRIDTFVKGVESVFNFYKSFEEELEAIIPFEIGWSCERINSTLRIYYQKKLESFHGLPSVFVNNCIQFHRKGILHRDIDEPSKITNCTVIYYRNGLFHRDGDKPAILKIHKPINELQLAIYMIEGVQSRPNGKPSTTSMTEYLCPYLYPFKINEETCADNLLISEFGLYRKFIVDGKYNGSGSDDGLSYIKVSAPGETYSTVKLAYAYISDGVFRRSNDKCCVFQEKEHFIEERKSTEIIQEYWDEGVKTHAVVYHKNSDDSYSAHLRATIVSMTVEENNLHSFEQKPSFIAVMNGDLNFWYHRHGRVSRNESQPAILTPSMIAYFIDGNIISRDGSPSVIIRKGNRLVEYFMSENLELTGMRNRRYQGYRPNVIVTTFNDTKLVIVEKYYVYDCAFFWKGTDNACRYQQQILVCDKELQSRFFSDSTIESEARYSFDRKIKTVPRYGVSRYNPIHREWLDDMRNILRRIEYVRNSVFLSTAGDTTLVDQPLVAICDLE